MAVSGKCSFTCGESADGSIKFGTYSNGVCTCNEGYHLFNNTCIYCPEKMKINADGKCDTACDSDTEEEVNGSCVCNEKEGYARYKYATEGDYAACVRCDEPCAIKDGYCMSYDTKKAKVDITGECVKASESCTDDAGVMSAAVDDSGICQCRDPYYIWRNQTEKPNYQPYCDRTDIDFNCSLPQNKTEVPECNCSLPENSSAEHCEQSMAGMGDCNCNFNASAPASANALVPYLFALAGLGGLVWYRGRKP